MKRMVLFLATNIAVLVVLSVIINIFGLDRWLTAEGINYTSLLVSDGASRARRRRAARNG